MNDINPILNWFENGSDILKSKIDNYFAAFPKWMEATTKIIGDSSFFGGETPHHGDFMLFTICLNSLTVEPTCLDEFPAMKAWCDRMQALPAMQKYLANRPGPNTPNWGKPGSLLMSMA